MTNIPNKLPTQNGDSLATQRLTNAINDILDYLQAKEEASKGEYKKVCGDRHYHSFSRYSDKCLGCDKTLDEVVRKPSNPPEYEESWEKEIREDNWDTSQGIMTKQTILRRGERIGNSTTILKVEMIINYIRDNFVSKEKIKKAIEVELEELRGTTACTFYDFADDLKESLGLGD